VPLCSFVLCSIEGDPDNGFVFLWLVTFLMTNKIRRFYSIFTIFNDNNEKRANFKQLFCATCRFPHSYLTYVQFAAGIMSYFLFHGIKL
jgi:hypothetical protein